MWRIDQPAARWLIKRSSAARRAPHAAKRAGARFLELGGLRQVRRVNRTRPAYPDQQSRPGPVGPALEFKAAGPYGWVRHPIYTGWFLMVFAVPLVTMTSFVFAATSSIYLLIAIPLEERSLRRSSSGACFRYMQEVRWKLVPHLFTSGKVEK